MIDKAFKVFAVLAALAALHIASHYFGIYQRWRQWSETRITSIRLGCRREAVGVFRKTHPAFPPDFAGSQATYEACARKFRVQGPGDSNEARTWHHPPSASVTVSSGGWKGADTGGWLYDRGQGKVAVDCTHPSSRGRPWLDH